MASSSPSPALPSSGAHFHDLPSITAAELSPSLPDLQKTVRSVDLNERNPEVLRAEVTTVFSSLLTPQMIERVLDFCNRSGQLSSPYQLMKIPGVYERHVQQIMPFLEPLIPKPDPALRAILMPHGHPTDRSENALRAEALNDKASTMLLRAELARIEKYRPIMICFENAFPIGAPATLRETADFCSVWDAKLGLPKHSTFNSILTGSVDSGFRDAIESIAASKREAAVVRLKKHPLSLDRHTQMQELLRDESKHREIHVRIERPPLESWFAWVQENWADVYFSEAKRSGSADDRLLAASDMARSYMHGMKLRDEPFVLQMFADPAAPKEAVRLPVRGSWHAITMRSACEKFGVSYEAVTPQQIDSRLAVDPMFRYLEAGTPPPSSPSGREHVLRILYLLHSPAAEQADLLHDWNQRIADMNGSELEDWYRSIGGSPPERTIGRVLDRLLRRFRR